MVLVQRLFPIELFNLKRSYAREVIRYVAKFGGNSRINQFEMVRIEENIIKTSVRIICWE